MAAVSFTSSDLEPFADIDPLKAQAMIDDAVAMAALVAPCINSTDFAYPDAAKAILRGAVLRWHESGTGAVQTTQAGPYSQTLDTSKIRRGMFWPSEIEQLQKLCLTADDAGKAFSVDTAPAGTVHLPWCSLAFGAVYCSCGVDIAGYPIFELDGS